MKVQRQRPFNVQEETLLIESLIGEASARGTLHDDAIRSFSRDDPNEVEKLMRMNRSLAEALAEEKIVRERLEERLANHMVRLECDRIGHYVGLFCINQKDEMATLKTQCDVDLDTSRLEVLRLKSQLRAVCEEQSLAELYGAFESNIARLLKENESLRRANLELETRDLDKAMQRREGPHALATKSGKAAESTHPSYLLELSNKENNRLLLKLKKSGQEREALRESFESLKMRERQFLISGRLAQDASRRLKAAHLDLQKTRKALEFEQQQCAERNRDLQVLKNDYSQLAKEEQLLRKERATVLAEVALLRERVREIDEEARRKDKIERFINKHVGNNSSGSTFDELRHLAGPTLLHHRKTDAAHTRAVQSVAGIGHGGLYLRKEEQWPSDSAALEEAIGLLHEGLIANCPILLPAFRKLCEQIHSERTRALEKNAQLLNLLGNGTDREKRRTAAGTRSGKGKVSPIPTKSHEMELGSDSDRSNSQRGGKRASRSLSPVPIAQSVRTPSGENADGPNPESVAYQRLLKTLVPDLLPSTRVGKTVHFINKN